MPDNAAFNTIIKFFANGKGCKQLLITHNVFFEPFCFCSVFKFDSSVNIRKTIAKQKEESVKTQHRRENAVCRGCSWLICLVFRKLFYGNTVPVTQNTLFNAFFEWVQMHIVDKRLILFAKNIEECFCLRSAAIKCTLNRHSIFVIVVLIIREYHQLRDIQEWAKCLVAHPFIDAFTFCKDSLPIIGFLYLYKCEWQAIYKACNIRAEIISRLFIFASELCGDMPTILIRVFKINQLNATVRGKHLIKLSTKIVILGFTDYLFK